MTAIEFLTFDHGSKRWWVLRGPDLAVSLTAHVWPAHVPPMGSFITDADGGQLAPDWIRVHRPDAGSEQVHCPALDRPCAGHDGEGVSGARQTLAQWAGICHDDAFLRAALAEHYAREVAA